MLAVFGQPLRIIVAAIALAAVLGFLANWETSFWQSDYSLYVRGHQIAPLNATALSNLCSELIIQREIDRAQPLLETGYKEYPQDSRINYNLGRLNYIKREYPKAEKYTRDAIRLDPISADSYVLLGQILLMQDRAQEAIQNVQRATQLNPYDPTYHTSYGILLKMIGDCASANAQFDQALALNPKDGLTQLQMRSCQASLAPTSNSATKASQP